MPSGLAVPTLEGLARRLNGGGENGFAGIDMGRSKSITRGQTFVDGVVSESVRESARGVVPSSFCKGVDAAGAFCVAEPVESGGMGSMRSVTRLLAELLDRQGASESLREGMKRSIVGAAGRIRRL